MLSFFQYNLVILCVLGLATNTMALTLEQGETVKNITPGLECTQVESETKIDPSLDSLMKFSNHFIESSQWTLIQKKQIKVSFMDSFLWCRTIIVNHSDQTSWHLVLNNARLDYVRFYWQPEDSLRPSLTSYKGDSRRRQPSSHNNPYDDNTAYPTFNIEIPRDHQGTVYFAVQSNSALRMRPTLYNSEEYRNLLDVRKWIQISYACFLAGMILMHLVAIRFQVTLEDTYFYNAIICAALYLWCFHGDASIWLRTVPLPVSAILLSLTILSSVIFALKFMQSYFDVPNRFGRLNDFYQLMSRLLLVMIGISPFAVFVNRLITYLDAATILISFMAIFYTLFLIVKQKHTLTWPAWILFLLSSIGVILTALFHLNLLPYNALTDYMLVWVYPLPVLALVPMSIARYHQHCQSNS